MTKKKNSFYVVELLFITNKLLNKQKIRYHNINALIAYISTKFK
jgi:hypothetical protein